MRNHPADNPTTSTSSLQSLRLRPEEEAVVLCTLDERNPAQQERLADLVHGDRLDWQRFWDQASLQQVSPVVARTLTGPSLAEATPGHAIDTAKTVRLQTVGRSLALHSELHRIGSAMRARNIPVTPLKGTHLAERLHHALDGRQSGDIDVLVQESDLEAARAVLRQMGYEWSTGVTAGIEDHPFHGVPFVRHGPTCTFVVELHWGLSDPRFITVDYDQLWRRILAQTGSEATLRPLPNEELLVFLALHLPKHDLGVLRLLADIDRLVRLEGATLEWDYVISLAQRWNVAGLLYFALDRSKGFLETPVPGAVIAALRPAAWRRALVGLLAGPQVVVRPPASAHLRSNRSRLAYCAMLSPARRAFDGYFHYLFEPYTFRKAGPLWGPIGKIEGLARGVSWTGWIIASALAEFRRAEPRPRDHRQVPV
jgi:hypothetical protein